VGRRSRWGPFFIFFPPQILNAIEQGDAQATTQLLPVVYDELRRLSMPEPADLIPSTTSHFNFFQHYLSGSFRNRNELCGEENNQTLIMLMAGSFLPPVFTRRMTCSAC
jgi:hypothetical protein